MLGIESFGRDPVFTYALYLHNDRVLLSEAGRLFERVGHLQDAEVCLIVADDLHADRKSFRREARLTRQQRFSVCLHLIGLRGGVGGHFRH
jgi:hypothetical protein